MFLIDIKNNYVIDKNIYVCTFANIYRQTDREKQIMSSFRSEKQKSNIFSLKYRIYDPRKSTEPLKEGGNIIPKKGARIIWTNDNQYLLVTGFTRDSKRLINLYTSQDLKQIASTELDVSPAILIPFYPIPTIAASWSSLAPPLPTPCKGIY